MLLTASTPASASAWHGCLDLAFIHNCGKTQLHRTYAQAPLKVQRPFYPEGEAICHSVALHTAGGIVGGDRLSQKISLDPRSRALLTTAAAAKVYRSNGLEAEQNINIAIAPQAVLEWFPQETILFDGAQYRQQLRVELAPTASFLGWDIARLGRSARGERFLNGAWWNNLEIWQAGQPLWIDRLWLPGNEQIWHSPNGLDTQPAIATFIAFSPLITPDIVTLLRQCTPPPPPARIGITQTQGSGILCRYRGPSTAEARQWFVQLWAVFRQSLWQSPACIPRVWQLNPVSVSARKSRF
jgi:urease accessory protein